MLYSLLRPLLFTLEAEQAHDTSLELLQNFRYLLPKQRFSSPREVMGLTFPNAVGLAAGLDKNADYLAALGRLGFGFIEVGTVTPRAQPGNPRPRLFRLPEYHSIINRMGFNNAGVDYLLDNVNAMASRDFVLGINIGKNRDTPVEDALDDYRLAMQKVYLSADYITINISSPNTPGLRDLQGEQALESLLRGISECRKELQDRHQCQRPVALKIAPDLSDEAIAPMAALLVKYHVDGLIATNTTIDRSAIRGHALAAEAGGLSGEALADRSRRVLHLFHQQLQDQIPIISAGGIGSLQEARLRLQLGASLVQVYSALIYQGPSLVAKLAKSL